MKILICGDSYAVTDPEYTGLHWSEKILDFSPEFEVINLAYGGSSNALIALQLSQGLRYNPEFAILTFTSNGRYEFDKDINAMPQTTGPAEIADYFKRRYTTNTYAHDLEKNRASIEYLASVASDNIEKLKNYFYIMYCLTTLQTQGVSFCYSLGGFAYKQDYNMFLNRNFVNNQLADFQSQELLVNLWEHGHKPSPAFHVDDPAVHTLFANNCIEHIQGRVIG